MLKPVCRWCFIMYYFLSKSSRYYKHLSLPPLADKDVIVNTLDSLDRNDDLQNRHALLSATGKSRGSAVQRLRKGPRTAYSTSLPCSREAVRLEITFGNYPERPKRMHLTIDSLVVTYVPPLSEAYEELSHTYRYRLMIDDREYNTFYYDEENSRPLRFPSPLLPPECDSLMER